VKVRTPKTATGQAYLRTLAHLWQHPALQQVAVEVNPRLSRSAGRYLPSQRVIELSAVTLTSPARFRREVLCHEAAHAVVWMTHGRKATPHGPEWQALVRQAGFVPRASLIRCGHRAQAKAPHRFRHVCDVCQFSRTANRRMSRWRCPECHAVGLEGHVRIQRVAPRR
jgi:predicted SprT family Zn-dependent metalloprotease